MESTVSESGSWWPWLIGLLLAAVAAVLVARVLHQRSRRRPTTPPPPPVDPELDRATRLRTILPEEDPASPPSAPPLSDARATAIVEEELARPTPGQQTSDEAAASRIAEEAVAHSDAVAVALATLPVEALPAFGDNVVVARGAGPQLLLATAREILDGQADEADGPDLPDPLVRALDGGGACMSLPAGAGAEAALFVLDLLAQPGDDGEPVHGEAWITIRHDDVFLSVPEAVASEALDTAAAEARAHFGEDDERFGQHLTAAVSTALEAKGLPYGARLYAYHAGRATDPETHVSLTDDAGGGYVAQWDSLEDPRLLPTDVVRRAWTPIPEDVRETLGL